MATAKKILIIDDDPDIVEAMKMPLESHGYEVVSASSGQEGLSTLVKESPDLIILDVMMESTTEGFQVAYAIRSDAPGSAYAKFRKIPILMVTAINQVMKTKFSKETDAEYLPVTEFIEKPIQPADLLNKVASLLVKA
ncbi:MAG TPA: response regulator [bacterium]|nr:response regulator [bacterium]